MEKDQWANNVKGQFCTMPKSVLRQMWTWPRGVPEYLIEAPKRPSWAFLPKCTFSDIMQELLLEWHLLLQVSMNVSVRFLYSFNNMDIPNSGIFSRWGNMFSDMKMVAWNWTWKEYLHHGNWQTLKIRNYFIFHSGSGIESQLWTIF